MASTMETTGLRSFPRLHWGAIAAGVLLALAVHVVMGLIGAAIGFAAAPADSKAVGAAAAIWAFITPFVATLCGAWLACRMAAADDARAAGLHGVLVWCIGLIAGALFLAGTAASGAMSAGTAASGNLGPAQRTVQRETGTTARGQARTAEARSEDAAKAAAAGAGGAALAALAGLLGGVVGAGLASRRRTGRGFGLRFGAGRHEEPRMAAPPSERGYGTTYGATTTPTTTRMPGAPPEAEGPPQDPYHH